MALLGCQTPRLSHVPDGDSARGDEAVEFAQFCGLTLYPWQEDLLRDMCRTTPEGLWSAREVAVVVARQNGKGEVLVARELAGLFLFGERLIYHTAHLMETSLDAMGRLWDVISQHPDLMSWWADEFEGEPELMKSNGKEAIHLPNGASAVFRTRTKKTGRGRTIDLLIFDECYDLPVEVFAAMNSTTAAVENAQKVFISSPVNRWEHMHGAIFSAKRWAGIDGEDILFKEWSMPEGGDPLDEASWRVSNPSLVERGPGVQLGEIRAAARSAAKSEELRNVFVVESLGTGEWYPRDGDDEVTEYVIDPDEWQAGADRSPRVVGDCCVGLDVAPGGAGVGMVAALRTAGGVHLSLAPVAVFDRDEVVRSVAATVEKNDPVAVVIETKGVGATLLDPLTKSGVEPEQISWSKITAACELMLTMFREGQLSHDGDPRWVEALRVAEFRQGSRGDRAFQHTSPLVSVLVAASFALWGLVEFEIPVEAPDVKRTRRFVGNAKSIPTTGAGAFAQSLRF